MRKIMLNSILLLCLSCPFLHAQIWAGEWITAHNGSGTGTSCHDEGFNERASASLIAHCTNPPNPISGFTLAGSVNNSCPNQVVHNLVEVWKVDSMTEDIEIASIASAWVKTIKDEIRSGNCNGGSTLIKSYYDPYGCDPPPPPPPPCTGCGSCAGCRPVGCQSPIAIDLLNEGMRFTSIGKGVTFDFNGDGKPLFMSWTDPNYYNAWLALDRDNNGTIDSAQELFGYPTEPQLPSRDVKRNGWLALAVYDDPGRGGNGDGVIDSNDAIYSNLLLWIDDSHDGVSQATELHHLAQMGVKKIPLKYGQDSYTDEFGNTFSFKVLVAVQKERRQAWDVVLDASETPPNRDVLCGPEKKPPSVTR